MFAVVGVSGQVGGAVARSLLAKQLPVRAVVRDRHKGAAWAERGCEPAVADLRDGDALTAAFRGAEGVFVMLPAVFDPLPGFPETRQVLAALRPALAAARPGRVVALSSIGAQAARSSLIAQLGLLEAALEDLPIPVAYLRPGWFLENAAWDVDAARTGAITSFLQPLDKPVPMVATDDVGRVAASLLQETFSGRRVVELEGPERVSPYQLAETFAALLHRPVRVDALPRERWAATFAAQGMKNPAPRIEMLHGFNQGWLAFEGGEASIQRGEIGLRTALARLIARAGAVDPGA